MSYRVISDPTIVREVLRRSDDFVPSNALTSVVPLSAATLRMLSRARFALPPVLASATGEKHRRVRAAVAAFFSPAKVAAIEPRVRQLTLQRCAASSLLLQSRPVDLASEISQYVPPAIMTELTGIASPELSVLKRWSRDSLELFWGWPDADRQLVLAASAIEFYDWLRAEVVRSRGGDSLFGVLDAVGLSTSEICSLGYFLVIAGQETTSQLINIAYYRALQSEATWHEVAQGASATPFVRGVLSTESSVPSWRRQVAADTQLNGESLPAGAEILLELSGHHDSDAHATAYTLAFGHGLHRCLGAKLAELEAVTVLEQTARALPRLTLVDADPEWIRLLSFQTPLSVLVAREGHVL